MKILYLIFRWFGWYFIEHYINNIRVIKWKWTYIDPSTSIRFPFNINIGENTYINKNCILWASNKSKILIGDNVLFWPNVKVFSSNHWIDLNKWLIREQDNTEWIVIIWDNCWIWSDVNILMWAKIWNWVVIWSNSVVRWELKDNGVYAGVPTKLIKIRN